MINEEQIIIIAEKLWKLYNGKYHTQIDKTKFDNDLIVELNEIVDKLMNSVNESNSFATDIARGDLTTPVPNRSNYLAAPLKQIHSNLKHLTWQTKQIEQGDYGQRVEFMGEFSEAFNNMVDKLSSREKELKKQINIATTALNDLNKTNNILATIFDNISDYVLVINENDLIFTNKSANALINKYISGQYNIDKETIISTLLNNNFDDSEFYSAKLKKWFDVKCSEINWDNKDKAKLYVISDVTDMKSKEMALISEAHSDNLTGIGNRTYGFKTLKKSIQEASKHPVSLCYLDFDNLKKVNDTYGHSEGDEFIKLIVKTISSSIRKDDIFARMGGDEFMLLFTQTSYETCLRIMHTINAKVNSLNTTFGLPYKLDFSYGIVQINADDDYDIDYYLAQADKKMYLHKKTKRDEQQ